MALTRAQILAKKSGLKTEQVSVPEWADEDGSDMYVVAEMTAADAEAWADSLTGERQKMGAKPGEMESYDLGNRRASLVARSVMGPDGQRIFTDGDVGWLGEQPSSLIQRLFEVASKLSNIGGDAEEAAAKNSDAVPSDGSSSGSAPNSDTPPPVLSSVS